MAIGGGAWYYLGASTEALWEGLSPPDSEVSSPDKVSDSVVSYPDSEQRALDTEGNSPDKPPSPPDSSLASLDKASPPKDTEYDRS